MASWLRKAQESWSFRGQKRPPFAIEPQPGQESVWDYPRPPAIVKDSRRVIVKLGDHLLADSTAAVRLCETASPPTFYIPNEDVNFQHLKISQGASSICEWKGNARYWSVAPRLQSFLPQSGKSRPVAWDYPQPQERFSQIANHIAFYPSLVQCFVDGNRVTPQAGAFYGGWITPEIVGPFKGDPGTSNW